MGYRLVSGLVLMSLDFFSRCLLFFVSHPVRGVSNFIYSVPEVRFLNSQAALPSPVDSIIQCHRVGYVDIIIYFLLRKLKNSPRGIII